MWSLSHCVLLLAVSVVVLFTYYATIVTTPLHLAATSETMLHAFATLSPTLFSTDANGVSVLMTAAEAGYVQVVTRLMTSPDVVLDGVDQEGRSVLMYAAKGGNLEILSKLWTRVTNHHSLDNQGWNIVFWAAANGRAPAVEFLLRRFEAKSMSSVLRRDKNGASILHWAAVGGHLEVVATLVSTHQLLSLLNSRDVDSSTPLHLAADTGFDKVVATLLDAGADVNAVDQRARTPLILACINGYVEVVAALLLHGADAGLRDDMGRTPLHYAVSRGHADVTKIILRALGAKGDITTVNQTDGRGHTALHDAVLGGRRRDSAVTTDLIRSLVLLGGASTTITTSNQHGVPMTPLHLAIISGSAAAVTTLTDSVVTGGSNTDLANQYVMSPDSKDVLPLLQLAILAGMTNTAQRLLVAGADASLRDRRGNTALHGAAFSGNVDVLDAIRLSLPSSSAFVGLPNVRNTIGVSALHQASGLGRLHAVEFLLKYGANVNIDDRSGKTPLHYACQPPLKPAPTSDEEETSQNNDDSNKLKVPDSQKVPDTQSQAQAQKALLETKLKDLIRSNDARPEMVLDTVRNFFKGSGVEDSAIEEGYTDIIEFILSDGVVTDDDEGSARRDKVSESPATIAHKVVEKLQLDLSSVIERRESSDGDDYINDDHKIPPFVSAVSSPADIVVALRTYGVDVARVDDDGKTAHDLAMLRPPDAVRTSIIAALRQPVTVIHPSEAETVTKEGTVNDEIQVSESDLPDEDSRHILADQEL